MRFSGRALRAVAAACLVVATGTMGLARGAEPTVDPGPVPRAQCGPGDMPETSSQGRASKADYDSGRAAKGYTCNTTLFAQSGSSGGFRVHRYTDAAGHECLFYDTAIIFPLNVLASQGKSPGVFVLDMADPAHPKQTATLTTPAMLSPHESLSLNAKRGLLIADMGTAATYPGFVDIYDVSKDCRHPELKSSSPLGILGHEGTFSPDGNTFWVSSTAGMTITALDISDPVLPKILWVGLKWVAHGMNVSDDGTRLYIADLADLGTGAGLTILDVTAIQQRKPLPQPTVVSHISWPEVSIPQTAIPVSVGGHPYLVEVDEFTRQVSSEPGAKVGAARMIDIADDTHPKVVSNMRLEVNMPANRAGDQKNDPGGNSGFLGYAAHYCAVPSRVDPGVVACSFMASGMRLFDIRDPHHPKELAYANFPKVHNNGFPASYAMSAPAFVPERSEIWYSDGFSGLYGVKVRNGVWPFATPGAGAAQTASVLGATVTRPAGQTSPAPSSAAPAAVPGELAATGGTVPTAAAGVALVLGLAGVRLRRLWRSRP